ncbi:LysR family transcriptional regulator [Camelimonas sp. ID_303_24]
MSVSMEQLEAFVAAAGAGSFSGAARRLGKAQSAVSTHIANLEEDLGTALFNRAGRTPALTAAGARLLPEAKIILDRRAHFIGVARSFEARVEKRLVMAIDELYPEAMVGELCAAFAGHFPHVELELLFPIMEDVSRLVLDGKAQIGVMWRQENLPPELGFKTIGWAPLKLVCGKSHPLAQTRVDWEDLKRHRQLMVTVRNESAERHRLRIAAEVWWVESHWVIMQILRHGVGWALIPAHIVDSSPVARELAIPELEFDAGEWPVALDVVWHKQKPSGPAAEWLRRRLTTMKLDPAPGQTTA